MTPISIKNLRKSYASNLVLDGINLEVEPGKIIGYIGPNGAGKSTTIKILTGIIPDFDGDVSVLGMDIRKDALEIKRRIGFIPENASLYESLSPMEYLNFVGQLYGLGISQIKQKAADLLQVFGLGDKQDVRMNTFSKGMKQKV